MSDEQLLGLRFLRSETQDRTLPGGQARAPPLYRARQAADRVPAARVAVGRMVFSRRRAGHRRAVLSRASAPRASRAPHDAQCRGRQRRKRDAHPAPRSRSRHRHRLPAAPPQALARSVRSGVAAVSGHLPRASRQPPLRAASRRVVRAGASLRGFRRDVCRLAQAQLLVAPYLCAVAGVPQARIRRRDCCPRCATKRPPVRNREVVEPLRENTRTLADHYRRKLQRYSMYRRTVTDHLLERVFTAERNGARAAPALSCARTRCTWSTPRCASCARNVTAWSRSCASSSSAPRSSGLWVRGSRRDALRHARWMLVYLTRLYAQGESPRLSL